MSLSWNIGSSGFCHSDSDSSGGAFAVRALDFSSVSDRLGRGAGLDFFQTLILPFTVIGGWLAYLGLDSDG